MNNKVETTIFGNLFHQLDKYQLSYACNGNFSESLTELILGLVETSMNVESESSKTKKKVYFIMVESLQNITRHQSKPHDEKLLDGFFSIHKLADGYSVTSGNLVRNEEVENLKSKIEKINSLDNDELRNYHKELLNSGEFSSKGGAGLGLIEMLRKSGNKLVYDFETVTDDYLFFYFQANVAVTADENIDAKPQNTDSLMLAKSIHKIVLQNNIKNIFHGQFGHDNLKGLLAMAENNVANIENVKLRKSIISVMIEQLQNICFHADGRNDYEGEGPGLFMISETETGILLITVNYINNSKTENLINYVDKINALSRDELRSLFLEILMKDDTDRKHGGGLGLLDIRIKTNNPIKVSIENFNNDLSYATIIAQINL